MESLIPDLKACVRQHYANPSLNLFPLEIVLREALNNAILHGSINNPGQLIDLRLKMQPAEVILEIEDHGPGIPRLAPRSSPDSLAESGRGFHIFMKYCSHIQVSVRPSGLSLKLPIISFDPNGRSSTHCLNALPMPLIKSVSQSDSLILFPQVDLLASSVKDARAELKDLLKDPPKRLEFNLTSVNMVDSSGIGLLIAVFNSLRETGGTMEVTEASPDIADLLCSMCLNRHFPINGQTAG